jgi:hypothetical protein
MNFTDSTYRQVYLQNSAISRQLIMQCIDVPPDRKGKSKSDYTFQNVTAISSDDSVPRLPCKTMHVGSFSSSKSSYTVLKTALGNIVSNRIVYHVDRQSLYPNADDSITKAATDESSTIAFHPVKLLSSMGFSLHSRRIRGFGSYNIRPLHIVPQDALIFELCREGDLINIQRLFSNGLASPFDTNLNGATALHVCFQPSFFWRTMHINLDSSQHCLLVENFVDFL